MPKLFAGDTTYVFIRPRRRVLSRTVQISTGVITATIPEIGAVLTGILATEGIITATIPSFDSSLTGSLFSEGELSATLPEVSAAIAGDGIATGELAGLISEMIGNLSGTGGSSGDVSGLLPEVTGELEATASSDGVLTGVLPEFAAQLTGVVETEDNLFALLPAITGELTGSVISEGEIEATLPSLNSELLGVLSVSGIIDVQLPEIQAGLFGDLETEEEGYLDFVLPMLIIGSRVVKMTIDIESQRRTTREFIMGSPVNIALIPMAEVHKASGAVEMVEGVPRPVQLFRRIPMSHTERPDSSTSGLAGSGGGMQRKYDLTLLGEWDAIVKENDYWIDETGQKYVVDALVPFNGYQVKALVMSYGRWAKTYG